MRKEGSFSVIRSHMVDQAYLKSQRQKEEEKRKREEKKMAAAQAAAKANQGFQLGDLWGNSAGSFGTSTGTGFGMKKPENSSSGFGFGTPANNGGGFGFGTTTTTNSSGGFGTKTAASVVAGGLPQQQQKKDTLIDKMNKLSINQNEPKMDINSLPKFPGQYLYIDDERTDSYESMGIDMSRYKEYLDMEKELLMEVDDEVGGETWQGEKYEKQHLPKGVDKQFKKFTERVEFNPTQCVRYEFNGQPLFYSSLYPQQQQQLSSRCQYCNGPKVFEFQLMPNILSILPTSEYATVATGTTESASLSGKAKNIDTKTVLDSWNVGMEFGTILVFVCQKDCHPGEMEDICYMEETIIVQYETD